MRWGWIYIIWLNIHKMRLNTNNMRNWIQERWLNMNKIRLNTYSKKDWILHHLSNHIPVAYDKRSKTLFDKLKLKKSNWCFYFEILFWLYFKQVILLQWLELNLRLNGLKDTGKNIEQKCSYCTCMSVMAWIVYPLNLRCYEIGMRLLWKIEELREAAM